MGVNAALLRKILPFISLTEAQLDILAELCEEKTVSGGQMLFQEGEPGNVIYLVPEGEIEVLITSGGESVGSMEWVGAGDVLGLRAFFPPYKYMSTASSLTDGSTLTIDTVRLRELVQQDGRLAVSIHEAFMEAMLKRIDGLRTKT